MPTPSARLIHHCCETLAKLSLSLLQRHHLPPHTTLRRARQLHALLVSSPASLSSPFLFNNLLSLYARSSSLTDACALFERMPRRTVVSYNTIISAYARDSDQSHHAFSLFFQMATIGVKPNASTLASLVRASSLIHEPLVGASVHAYVMKSGLLKNGVLQTVLVGMYCKLGWSASASQVFDEMPERDVIAFNSAISCNIMHGGINQALRQFLTMLSEGLVPNQVTYTLVLNAYGRTEDLKSGRIIHGKIIRRKGNACVLAIKRSSVVIPRRLHLSICNFSNS